MGNNPTLKIIRGKDKMKEYSAPLAFDAQDRVTKRCNSVRTFCADCSSMLWNWDSEWPDWIYLYASSIDTDLPQPPKGVECISVLRDSCPEYVPIPVGFTAYNGYGPGLSIEDWHKKNGCWID